MKRMPEKLFNQMLEYMENGDPLKDINLFEYDLAEYLIAEREYNEELKEKAWKYDELCK